MSQQTPAVVGLYFRESGQWRRIAEFRLSVDGHATFRAIDPIEGLVARVWYQQGVDILDAEHTVLPEDGPAFLRALLQPFGFRDYRFRDDTRSGANAGNGLPRKGTESLRRLATGCSPAARTVPSPASAPRSANSR